MFDFEEHLIKVFGTVKPEAYVISFNIIFNILAALWLLKVLCEVILAIDNCDGSFIVEPFYALTILPETVFGIRPWYRVCPEAVLFPAEPHSLILSKVCPCVNTEAMLLVISVLALVPPAILPCVHTHAFHVVVKPFALVLSAIEPCVCAYAAYLVLVPLALVAGAVVP